MQVAAERVGSSGRVIGLDLARLEPFGSDRIVALTGDVRDPAVVEELRGRLEGLASVVLCDLAPKLTGIRDTDEARGAELAGAAIGALPQLLRPGGRLLIKLFMNSELSGIVEQLGARFEQVENDPTGSDPARLLGALRGGGRLSGTLWITCGIVGSRRPRADHVKKVAPVALACHKLSTNMGYPAGSSWKSP